MLKRIIKKDVRCAPCGAQEAVNEREERAVEHVREGLSEPRIPSLDVAGL